jgi:hypothetical protein
MDSPTIEKGSETLMQSAHATIPKRKKNNTTHIRDFTMQRILKC